MLDRRRFLEMAALAAVAAPAALGARGRVPPFDPATADAAAMAAALKRGQVTAAALVETALARLAQVNGELNAARFVYAEAARAAAAGTRGAAPLAGLPSFTKDLEEEEGRAYTSGSRAYALRVGVSDSPTAAALKASGLISLGRTTTPEFGLLPTTEPLLGGATCNPWNLRHSAGGSSGGAAALVAAGVVPFAHASDGGGSIRIPASVNGLVGLKPSRGRMAGEEGRRQIADFSVNGCVSRSVRDTAAWLAANESRRGPYRPVGLVSERGRRGLRIGIRAEGCSGLPDADVAAVFETARGVLARLGHQLVAAPLPFDAKAAIDAFLTLWSAGAAGEAAVVEKALGADAAAEALEPATRGFAALGREAGAGAIEGALGALAAMQARYLGQYDAFDVLMTPVLATPPPELGWLAPTVPFETLVARTLRYVGYTPIENAAGNCAISLPLGVSSGGLPIGMQFAAPPGQERRLLELAYGIEQARPWAGQKPAVWAG
jgi:amidase